MFSFNVSRAIFVFHASKTVWKRQVCRSVWPADIHYLLSKTQATWKNIITTIKQEFLFVQVFNVPVLICYFKRFVIFVKLNRTMFYVGSSWLDLHFGMTQNGPESTWKRQMKSKSSENFWEFLFFFRHLFTGLFVSDCSSKNCAAHFLWNIIHV